MPILVRSIQAAAPHQRCVGLAVALHLGVAITAAAAMNRPVHSGATRILTFANLQVRSVHRQAAGPIT
jgi:hypothetical protein